MLSLRRKNFLTSPRRCFWTKIPKKSPKFAKFSPWIGFFYDFAKQASNFPKTGNLIYLELHLSQFSAKSENLFFRQSGGRAVGRAAAHYHSLRSRLFQERGVVVMSTARARLARVEFQHSTCKTSWVFLSFFHSFHYYMHSTCKTSSGDILTQHVQD